MLERKAVHRLYASLTKCATAAAAAAAAARIINNVVSVNMYTCYIHTSIFPTTYVYVPIVHIIISRKIYILYIDICQRQCIASFKFITFYY